MRNDNPEQWNGKSRGGSFGYAFFVFLIRYCGLRSAYIFLAFVAFYFIIDFYSSGRVNLTLYVIGLVCVLMVVDGVPSDTNFAITTNRCVSEAPFIRVQVERVRI